MKILERLYSKLGDVRYTYKKHKPEIMIVGGTISIIGAVISMWNVRDKISGSLDIHEDRINGIKEIKEKDLISSSEYKKEVTRTYIETGLNIAKDTGLTVALLGGGLLMIFSSYKDLKNKNAGLISAYNVLSAAFKSYRERVIEEEGADADRHYRYGTKREENVKVITDENGKKKKVKETTDIFVNTSDFSRIFDKCHSEFHREEFEGIYAKNANFMWLLGIEASMSRRLQINHQLTLNEVYEALRMPKSYAGSFVGWRDIKHGGKSDYISFGLKDRDKAWVNLGGGDYGILLEFDVDGVILDDKYDEISGTDAFAVL